MLSTCVFSRTVHATDSRTMRRVEASHCQSGAVGRGFHCQTQLDAATHCRLHRTYLRTSLLITRGIKDNGAHEYEFYQTDLHASRS